VKRFLKCYDAEDFREAARRRLPKGIFEFVDRGSGREIGLRDNISIYDRIGFLPRVLSDVSSRTTAATLFNKPVGSPIIIAPTGSAGLLWYEGELALAKAAARHNIPFTLATGSMTAMEKISAVEGLNAWFQCYVWNDRELSYQLIKRAKSAGFGTLVVTVDNPVQSSRAYNARNGFSLPFRLTARASLDMLKRPGWFFGVLGRYILNGGMPRYQNYPPAYQNSITRPGAATDILSSSLTWDDIKRVREIWPHTLIVKGILRSDDVGKALKAGVDGVILSNHGARNLDSAVSPLEVLPEVAALFRKKITLLVDGGVRQGSDIAKAIALGADGVLVGRLPLYGTAAGGEGGAFRALAILQKELETTLAYVGCNTVQDLDASFLARRAYQWR
jgi:(S)-mandelate dehydrogenase